jgi:hypothetical protein
MNFSKRLHISFTILLIGILLLNETTIATEASASRTPQKFRRNPEQTFLTFPEWFLVHSPAEYAVFVQNNSPSDFPFLGHIRQIWSSYEEVYTATKDKYPFNTGYHVMIVVIATSTTIEYAIKGAYEILIGRISNLTSANEMTEEDGYNAKISQDYVDFIRVRPWYEYNFIEKLRGLWSETSFSGSNFLRKWERKYFLTSEYLAKAFYGWVIMKATKAGYDEESTVTAVIVNQVPDGINNELTEVKKLQNFADGSELITIPRYQAFTKYAIGLSQHDIRFEEIAGNNTIILVSVLALANWLPTPPMKRLFQQPILTQPARKREVLIIPVTELGVTLKNLTANGIEIEHIYDY